MQAERPLEASPMTKPARRRATYQDLCDAPENLVAELIDGELFLNPRPALPHALAATRICADLGPYDRAPGHPPGPSGWWILFEPELHLGDDVLVPDAAGWRRESLPVLPNVVGVRQPSDFVLEVISPSTGRLDRVRKLPVYARAGVSHAWLVDPIARTLEIFRREGARWMLLSAHGGDEAVRAEPFDAVELALSRWWIPDAPQAAAETAAPGA